ncbi:MAG: BMP family ABC transporter substrate-binding protein, partial [Firmicutes bacterium]|nr:BMP family ABC transporter substrate-binding protein [Bacillota bacterium]
SYADKLPDSPRVAAWSSDLYAYGTMVGVTAGEITETNKIGIVSGVPIEVLKIVWSGVIEGAKTVNPAAEVMVSWTGDWSDLAKQSELAKLQLGQGCDVMHSMAGVKERGVLEATEAAGAYYIGYMSDVYQDAPSAVVTSVICDTPPMYREVADAFLAGTLEKKINILGLERFTLTDFHGMIPAETEAKVHETIKKLKAGEIKVPYVLHPEL